MSGHVVPVKTYILIFVGLMILTAATTGAAFVDMGMWNTPVALLIAVTKMLLVVLFFMHVKYTTASRKSSSSPASSFSRCWSPSRSQTN